MGVESTTSHNFFRDQFSKLSKVSPWPFITIEPESYALFDTIFNKFEPIFLTQHGILQSYKKDFDRSKLASKSKTVFPQSL